MGRCTWHIACLTVLGSLIIGGTSTTAFAADSVYWNNFTTGGISLAGLNGSGGGNLTSGEGSLEPEGVAIDPVTNKIYSAQHGKIRVTDLTSGETTTLNITGITVLEAQGIAIDPGAGKIYWANFPDPVIAYANLDGSGAGVLDTSGAPIDQPAGIAIDPPANKIYWVNFQGNTVAFANLDGSGGGGQVNTAGATVDQPNGIALDKARNRLMWANPSFVNGTIGYANLDGSGGANFNTAGAPVTRPYGLAIDAAANRVYWSQPMEEQIAYANLDDTGNGGLISSAGAANGLYMLIALLKAPVGTAVPIVTASTSVVGSTLSCSSGRWQNNVAEAQLYNAPAKFEYQWQRNGTNIVGGTASSLKTSLPGAYTCVVTASNHAGSVKQTSSSQTIACPTVKATISKPTGKRGRNRAGSWSPGARLIANSSTAATLTVQTTGTATNRSTGRRFSFKLPTVTNLFVGADAPRRFAQLVSGRNKQLLKPNQAVRLTVKVTPTPAVTGCVAQAKATQRISSRISKIIT